jgi:hypothetical protein
VEGNSRDVIWDIPAFSLKCLRNTIKNLSQESWFPAGYLNLGPAGYGAGIVPADLHEAMTIDRNEHNKDAGMWVKDGN